jgi:hypothetical protein
LTRNAAASGQFDQSVAHIPRAARDREQLARFFFERERDAHVAFKERALRDERPRS